jgi:hypothetical protein
MHVRRLLVSDDLAFKRLTSETVVVSKSKSSYDRRLVGQSVLVSRHHQGP